MNRVILVGRLTRDPDLRYTPNGVAVANFNIAVNRPFKKEGEQQQADFINGVVWRKPAENLANYMKKGSQIGVDGRVQTRIYEGQDGKTVYVTEVVADSIQFLESKGNQGSDNHGSYGQSNSGSQPNVQPSQNNSFEGGDPIDISDDDLPF
ncbi:single-stranded DNA-binding protein [Oceanobacillus profundus]|uniref:Single-stranded DNA-binding protein n=1 Tax=Oceanobacillus profundus TaxID=372463 RepID=A0A417YL39_9BACI|nr:single-stranded DNA-binding protein [Oceanobacillus profundus]